MYVVLIAELSQSNPTKALSTATPEAAPALPPPTVPLTRHFDLQSLAIRA